MLSPVHILWIDDYHLGDPLFAQSLARHLAQVEPAGRRVIVVHGSGERAERLLEVQGKDAVRIKGVLQVDGQDRVLVDRALREANKDLAAVLTEFGVAAVGIQGSDRGLLKIADDNVPGAANVDWLFALVESGSVPVVSALAGVAGGATEIGIGDAVGVIANALGPQHCLVVVFPKSGAGVSREGEHLLEIAPEQLTEHLFEDQKDVLSSLGEKGFSIRLTSARHAISADSARYTRVLPVKTP